MLISVVIIIHPYFWENCAFIDSTKFMQHTVAVLGIQQGPGIGRGRDVGIGNEVVLFSYLLHQCYYFSGIVQTSENNLIRLRSG